MKKKLTLLSFEELAQEGRWITFFASAALADQLFVVFRAQDGPKGFERWLDWIFFCVFLTCWPILAIKRLRSLHLSWAWFLPLGLCYAVEWVAFLHGRKAGALIASGLAVLTQLPFFFLSSSEGAESVESPPSGQPAA